MLIGIIVPGIVSSTSGQHQQGGQTFPVQVVKFEQQGGQLRPAPARDA